MSNSAQISFRSVLRIRPLLGSEQSEEENDLLRQEQRPENADVNDWNGMVKPVIDGLESQDSRTPFNSPFVSPARFNPDYTPPRNEQLPTSDPTLSDDIADAHSHACVVLMKSAAARKAATPWKKTKAGNGKSKVSSQEKFRFDSVLPCDSSQQHVYETIGRKLVNDSLTSLLPTVQRAPHVHHTHTLFSLGVSNSGKSYTLFGKFDNDKQSGSFRTWTPHDNDGVVPRMIDDLFANFQSIGEDGEPYSNYEEKEFVVELSMMEVHNERVYDLLVNDELCEPATDERKRALSSRNVRKQQSTAEQSSRSHVATGKGNHTTPVAVPLKIHQDNESESFFVPGLTHRRCVNAYDARRVLAIGLEAAKVAATSMNDTSSRSHIIISIQPSLIGKTIDQSIGEEKVLGGKIMVFDLAGIERTKKTAVAGASMRESININASVGGVMTCLRALKWNQSHTEGIKKGQKPKLVPYRDSKLTMLLQPTLSGKNGTAVVTMLVSAYPGSNDYAEKRSLLKEVDSLRGLTVPSSVDKGKTFSPKKCCAVAKTLIKKSPLRSPLKKLSPMRHFRKKEKVVTMPEYTKEDILEENANLSRLNAHLKKNCQDLLENNRSLQNELKTRGDAERAKKTFEDEDYVASRKQRHDQQCLLPTPLRNHIQSVQASSDVWTGQLHRKHLKPPFQLALSSKWLNQDVTTTDSRRTIKNSRKAETELDSDCEAGVAFAGTPSRNRVPLARETSKGSRKKLKLSEG